MGCGCSKDLIINCCAGSKTEEVQAMLEGCDNQTVDQFLISVSKVEGFIEDQPQCPKSFDMTIKNEEKQPQPLDKEDDAPLPFPYAKVDEDWPTPGFLEALGVHFLNGFPVKDKDSPFPVDFEARNQMVDVFLNEKLSKIYSVFRDAEVGVRDHRLWTDEGTSLYAFGGASSQYTRKIETDEKDWKVAELADENPVYVHDVTGFGAYEVREPFERYGAAAYFNDKFEVVGIYLCEFEKVFTPKCTSNTKLEWEHAKWAWRTTAITTVTFYDHLLKCHMIEAQTLVVATRENLPFDHPMRRFLKPHCFRTIYINHKTLMNLFGEGQLTERTFAFTYSTAMKAMNDLYNAYQFELLPDIFASKKMDGVPDSVYPVQTDVNEFWVIVRKYVASYVAVYWKTDDDLAQDAHLRGWWNALVSTVIKRKDLVEKFTVDTVVDVIAHFICNGSIWHQYVGNAQEYLKYPDIVGSKIRKGQTYNEMQNYVQAVTVGILTGVPMPDLINDWTFVLLNDVHRQQNINIMSEFQSELLEMSIRVNERNKNRRMPMKFTDPKVMDVSLGI
mmetsp:Transcript_67055/g.106621  ORF Transcript_67055/g.106621 Transcript_67055/m.106621 type:complete len:558 (+) Transcript_67055:26-1699(+)|eukprot:CAMPEP_0197055816 /NCGR_PEP_ID=MMETSP1384-20130603/74017_1 /TAXON_ID=29189 /ORGANISM="Ammonia sp." /LENGTH=557 /DNA_ID=CAMNT_0042489537 /DNA_START=25 /DNA_END=1698 /DNA_ORIENTATION=-